MGADGPRPATGMGGDVDLGELLGTAAKEAKKHPELLSSVVGLVQRQVAGGGKEKAGAKKAGGPGGKRAGGAGGKAATAGAEAAGGKAARPSKSGAGKQGAAARKAGLAGLLGDLDVAGLADQVGSWVGTGKNKRVTGKKVEQALGSKEVAKAAKRAGVSQEEAAAGIAKLLPAVVDYLTPDGKVPPPSKQAKRLDALGKAT